MGGETYQQFYFKKDKNLLFLCIYGSCIYIRIIQHFGDFTLFSSAYKIIAKKQVKDRYAHIRKGNFNALPDRIFTEDVKRHGEQRDQRNTPFFGEQGKKEKQDSQKKGFRIFI